MSLSKDRAKEMGAKSSRKGIPNKSTAEVRELFLRLVEKNIVKIDNDLEQMRPEQRVKAIISLAKIVLPPLRQEEMQKDREVVISFVD